MCQPVLVLPHLTHNSAYPVHELVSEVHRSVDDAQVVSCHHYLVIFRPFVEQLARRLLYQL